MDGGGLCCDSASDHMLRYEQISSVAINRVAVTHQAFFCTQAYTNGSKNMPNFMLFLLYFASFQTFVFCISELHLKLRIPWQHLVVTPKKVDVDRTHYP